MKSTREKLPPDLLKRVLEYNPNTGEMTWQFRPPELFTGGSGYRQPEGRANNWNAKWAGKPAFTTVNPSGYHCGAVFELRVLAHRVAWALHHGEWPCGEIDHINGDKCDNRISNLRDVSHDENLRNQPRRITNKSGVTGVFWTQRANKWRSYISINSRLTHLGYFENFEDAVAARKRAEKQNTYHPNHGRKGKPSAA